LKIIASILLFLFTLTQLAPIALKLSGNETIVELLDCKEDKSPEKDDSGKKDHKYYSHSIAYKAIFASTKFSYCHNTHSLASGPALDICTPPPDQC
jgi:hypothetical protein